MEYKNSLCYPLPHMIAIYLVLEVFAYQSKQLFSFHQCWDQKAPYHNMAIDILHVFLKFNLNIRSPRTKIYRKLSNIFLPLKFL